MHQEEVIDQNMQIRFEMVMNEFRNGVSRLERRITHVSTIMPSKRLHMLVWSLNMDWLILYTFRSSTYSSTYSTVHKDSTYSTCLLSSINLEQSKTKISHSIKMCGKTPLIGSLPSTKIGILDLLEKWQNYHHLFWSNPLPVLNIDILCMFQHSISSQYQSNGYLDNKIETMIYLLFCVGKERVKLLSSKDQQVHHINSRFCAI